MIDLNKAKEHLASGTYTCVACRADVMYTATERGVKPLLRWLDEEGTLTGFSAADKVVGKGAAFLYVLLRVRAVYATVMSRPAKEVLQQHGIAVSYDCLAEAIRNRAGDGFCPVETAVRDVKTPQEALSVICKTVARLSKNAAK